MGKSRVEQGAKSRGMYDRNERMDVLEVDLEEMTLKIRFGIEFVGVGNEFLTTKAKMLIDRIL